MQGILSQVGKILFPVCVLVLLLVMGIVGARDGEHYLYGENRMTDSIPQWQDTLWISGKWQRQVNKAMADHLPLAIATKSKFFWLRNGILYEAQKRVYNFTDYYVHFRNKVYLYGDSIKPYLLYDVRPFNEKNKELLQAMAHQINNAAVRHADKDFYVYYIERDRDLHFDTKGYENHYEFVRKNLTIPDDHIACFRVKDFNDYKQYFYHTDHHWQYLGSYKGYKEVFRLLGLDKEGEKIIVPTVPSPMYGVPDDCPPAPVDGNKPVLISRFFHGLTSRLTGTFDKFQEKFYVYAFDYLPMHITINGKDRREDGTPMDYGNAEKGLKDNSREWNMSYGYFYGGDEGEIIFDTGRRERQSILIIGDSFDNAILKLLACHYNKTYSIDLRHYENTMKKPFSIDEYMSVHKIDKVLFIGQNGLFVHKEFRKF